MAENQSSPIFADRYRFEPVDDTWDRGRSGYTHLVYDLKEKRLGVIKRAEIGSQNLVHDLENEIIALRTLNGVGVPKVYDFGEAVYRSKTYKYVFIEFIDGIRIENNLNSLSSFERKKIIVELFGILSHAHEKGIVNGDVDLKHMFWYREKQRLVVIDWGNAKLNVDPKQKSEFCYDFARAAEIIFCLVTFQNNIPATGMISLPNDSEIQVSFRPIPNEIRTLCQWAPRTPSIKLRPPYTAKELFETSRRWFGINEKSSNESLFLGISKARIRVAFLALLSVCFLLIFFYLPEIVRSMPFGVITNSTNTSTEIMQTVTIDATPTGLIPALVIPTNATVVSPIAIPLPRADYSRLITFDSNLPDVSCWHNEVVPFDKPVLNDGFYRRTDQYWGFRVQVVHSPDEVVQTNFSSCVNQEVNAFALNIAIHRLQPPIDKPLYKPGREVGFFVEGNMRREYTVWIDEDKFIYLRIRENNLIISDKKIFVINSSNLHVNNTFPISFEFPLVIFFEVNNEGLDILYMFEGALDKPMSVDQINPTNIMRVDNAILPTVGRLQKFGIEGRGGKTEVQVWPLVLFGK